ncbi:MAG: HIT domain-containing protein [Verrucomicrobia bacterium]|nr:HIT domain-containing protein [Verrucomicrobiota bacterium]
MATRPLLPFTAPTTSILHYAQPSPSANDLIKQAIQALSTQQQPLMKAAIEELATKYPDVAQQIFFLTWEAAGKPTFETNPDSAHADFGQLAFYGEEGRSIGNEQRMEILSRLEKTTCELCNPAVVDEQIVYWDGRYWNVLCPSSPATRGHLIIEPRRHVDQFHQLTEEEAGALVKVFRKCAKVYQHLYKTGDYRSTLQNAGPSDRSLPHFHLHLIPVVLDPVEEVSDSSPITPMKKIAEIRETFAQIVVYPQEIKSLGKLLFSTCPSEIDSKLLHAGIRWRLQVLLERVSDETLKKQIQPHLERLGDARIATQSQFFTHLKELDHRLSSNTVPFSLGRDRHDKCTPFRFNQVSSRLCPMNGSFIKFPEDGQSYLEAPTYCIAMNAPLPSYFLLTLQMYMEQNVKIVVNLTEFEEGELVKADRYLPSTPHETIRHGNYSITSNAVAQTQLPNEWIIEQNDCLLKDGHREHLFTSFHVRGWKDHTPGHVPSIAAAIKIIAEFEKLMGEGTVVVHCSGGIGRTGVFIAGKKILDAIEQKAEPDIRWIAACMRLQRKLLGGSEEQYKVVWGLPDEFKRLNGT